MKRCMISLLGPKPTEPDRAPINRSGLFWLRLNVALAACAAASLLLLALIGMGGI